jgi:SHS2 domain-containing protein
MKFEFLEHTADMKFRAYGRTLNEAFENAGLAVSSYLAGGKKVKDKIAKSVELKGEDEKSLFYNFLDEIIYLLDAEGFLVARAKVKIKGNSLIGKFYGDKTGNYDTDEIKAATYAEMVVRKDKKGWVVQAVMDV